MKKKDRGRRILCWLLLITMLIPMFSSCIVASAADVESTKEITMVSIVDELFGQVTKINDDQGFIVETNKDDAGYPTSVTTEEFGSSTLLLGVFLDGSTTFSISYDGGDLLFSKHSSEIDADTNLTGTTPSYTVKVDKNSNAFLDFSHALSTSASYKIKNVLKHASKQVQTGTNWFGQPTYDIVCYVKYDSSITLDKVKSDNKEVTYNFDNIRDALEDAVKDNDSYTIEVLLRMIGDADESVHGNNAEVYSSGLYCKEFPEVRLVWESDDTEVVLYTFDDEEIGEVDGLSDYLLSGSSDLDKDVYQATTLLREKVVVNKEESTIDSITTAEQIWSRYKNMTEDELDELLEVEKWMYSAGNYMLYGENYPDNLGSDYNVTKISSKADVYAANEETETKDNKCGVNISGKDSAERFEDQETGLTYEEYLRVKAFLTIGLFHLDGAAYEELGKDKPELLEEFYYRESSEIESVDIYLLTRDHVNSPEEVKVKAELAINKYAKVKKSNLSLQGVMAHVDDLVYYNAAKMYGYVTESVAENNEDFGEDARVIAFSQYLEGLTPDVDLGDPTFVVSFSEALPHMKNMGYIEGTDTAYKAYGTLYYLIMLMNKYAESEAGLDYVNGNWESNKTIDRIINDYNNNGGEVELTSDVIRYIQPYLAIARAINYLGVDVNPDSALYKIVERYNTLQNIEDTSAYSEFEYLQSNAEPMDAIFSMSSHVFSEDYALGVALSATYTPLQTNLYELDSLAFLEDAKWVNRFHYGYGFYRKALYIDTNVNAAIERYTTQREGTQLRVATLRDMLQPEKDVVLYVDKKFYNVNELADMMDKVYDNLSNTSNTVQVNEKESDTTWLDRLANTLDEINDRDVVSVVKTGDKAVYSESVEKHAKEYTERDNQSSRYIFDSNTIDKYLNVDSMSSDLEYHDEYTVLQPFAVVSAIYRDKELYRIVKNQNVDTDPVFVSSPGLAAMVDVDREEFNTIYNYIMLKNLAEVAGIDYKTTLDLDSPLYMDIYGNIVTESGLVVIPAASNATLYEEELYNIYNSGFLYLYSQGNYKIPADLRNSEEYIWDTGWFEPSDETGYWEICDYTVSVAGKPFHFYGNNLALQSDEFKATVRDLTKYLVFEEHSLKFRFNVFRVTEILRGAPIEAIDKSFEGLARNDVTDTGSIWLAAKLEYLINELFPSDSESMILTLPNLAFMENVEYIILFLFKIVCAALMVLLVVRVYTDVVDAHFGVNTMMSFVLSLVLFLVSAFSIPDLMDLSYYQVNKILLQDEAEYIEMLTLEKNSLGREISMTEVSEPKSNTELFVKMDDLQVPWYDLLWEILFSSSTATVSEAYDELYSNSVLYGLPGMERKGNGLYISMDQIFEDSIVDYDPIYKCMYTGVRSEPYASYILPYYVILDSLVADINAYNTQNNIENFNSETLSNGSIKTKGIISAYLQSQDFMEWTDDPLGMKYVYGLDTLYYSGNKFSDEDIKQMKCSYWYQWDVRPEKMAEYMDELSLEARLFVARHRNMLGHVTDETFLKVMAMSMAVKHNNIVGLSSADAIEIYNVDSKDIIRLSVADKELVMRDSSKSFARFIYDNCGTLGVFLTTILLAVYFVASWVKPLCIGVVIIVSVAALVLRRLAKKTDFSALEGFVISLTLLCGINALSAVCMKGCMSLAGLGLTPTVAILLQVVIQILYLVALVKFTEVVIFDWQSLGMNSYKNTAISIGGKLSNFRFNNFGYGGTPAFAHARAGFWNNDRDRQAYNNSYRAQRNYRPRRNTMSSRELMSSLRDRDERRLSRRGRK